MRDAKELQMNGGMCLNCSKKPGDPKTLICEDCQDALDYLVNLVKGPGIRVTIEGENE